MVSMYMASRTHETELEAARASTEFAEFIRSYVDEKRASPGDDLLTELIVAEEDGEKLSTDELITTCILLLNAGHEATAHTFGNAIKCLLEHGTDHSFLSEDKIDATVEELLRFDPPLHKDLCVTIWDSDVDRYLVLFCEISGGFDGSIFARSDGAYWGG